MIRKYPALLLAAACGWFLPTATTQAATSSSSSASGTAVNRLTANDPALIKLLDPDQLKQWNDAEKQIKDGQAKIDQGNALKAETANGGSITGGSVEDDHAKGNTLVNDGTKLRQTGMNVQNRLRTAARQKGAANKAAADVTATLNLSVPTAQWPDAVSAMSAQLFKTLSSDKQKYKHVYLAGVYALEDSKYVAKADLSDQVRKALAGVDKDGKLFDPKNDANFKLMQENGKLAVSYSGRAVNQQSNTKTAVIVGEVLYEPLKGYAAVSLRAVDLSTMRIVANQVMELSVEPSLGKMLGLTQLKVPSKRVVPAAPDAAKTADAPEPAVTLNLDDPANYLGSKARNAAGLYGIASTGRADSLENRFAILMLKSYFLDKQPDVKISDADFLTLALPAEKPADLAAMPPELSGIMLLPNVATLADATALDSLKVREMPAGPAELVIGKVDIKRNLPKLDLPSMADLRDGGYGASK